MVVGRRGERGREGERERGREKDCDNTAIKGLVAKVTTFDFGRASRQVGKQET